MKIITPGNKVRKWYAGHRLRCDWCGGVIELEENDHNQLMATVTSETFSILCPCSNQILTLNKESCRPQPLNQSPLLPISESPSLAPPPP